MNAPPPVQITNLASNVNFQVNTDSSKNIINEFDVITKQSEDTDDIEFERLAAESLSKSAKVLESLPTNTSGPIDGIEWNAFEDKLVNKSCFLFTIYKYYSRAFIYFFVSFFQ